MVSVVSVVSVHSPQLLPRPGWEVAVIITPIMQIGKLRLREVKPLQLVGGRVLIESRSDRRQTPDPVRFLTAPLPQLS